MEQRETQVREILLCEDDGGRSRTVEWLESLDRKTRFRVEARIDRLEDGNFGDVRPIGEGVSELRLTLAGVIEFTYDSGDWKFS